MSDEQTADRIGFITILHTQEHRGEATLWAVPAQLAQTMAKAIAYETPPREALLILGPANVHLVQDTVEKLRQVLREAGVDVKEEELCDD